MIRKPETGVQRNGIVLTGGGARAAFQAGVLAALADMLPDRRKNPFPIVSGTSAGSINAVLLAAGARDFGGAIDRMNGIWRNLTVQKVFRADARTMLGTGFRWLAWMTFLRSARFAPRALLDNAPLRAMVESHGRFARIRQAIDSGDLHALAITAASYGTGRSVSFFQGRQGLVSWSRTRRDGIMAEITLDHLMASVALPIIFPAVAINGEYFGDGSMRQAAPLSAPIHLGADRLLVIGTRNEDPRERYEAGSAEYPSFGEIGGYILDSLFMDSLYADLERLRRINALVRQLGRSREHGLEPMREIEATVIVPSEDIRDIAHRYARRMPYTVRTLLRLLGATRHRDSQLASYLMFDGRYCRELIELGRADAMKHRDALAPFIASAAAKAGATAGTGFRDRGRPGSR